MRGLLHDSGDHNITRCICGAWTYKGRTCSTCVAISRGDTYASDRTDEDLPSL